MADNKPAPEIRIVKKGKGHAGHHGGAWKVAYADFVTALMAFFLVMWIVGLSSNVKAAIAGYFKDPVAFMDAVNSGTMAFGVSGLDSGGIGRSNPAEDAAERSRLKKAKESIEKIISVKPEFQDMKKYIDVKLVNEGLLIDLLEAKQSLFFDAGSARVKPGTQHLLTQIASELGKLPNKIIIEGHTDSRPLARSDGYTNWELSSDRANSARRVMESAGLRSKQVDQVRGYAATHPRTPQDPTHFSNRRVSIIVVMKGRSTEAPSLSINSDIIAPQATKANTEQPTDNKKISHSAPEHSTGSTKPAIDPSNPIGINTSFGPVTKH